MSLFLRETWELFWWAMFCPSRLQKRMNEWLPQVEKDGARPDTNFRDILFLGNLRFISQYLLLLFISNIPLIFRLITSNQLLDWLQLLSVILIGYGIAVFFLPVGLVIPWLWWIVILQRPDSWLKGLTQAIRILPPLLPQMGLALAVLGISLSLTTWLVLFFSKHKNLSLARNVSVVGGTISIMLGGCLVTQNIVLVVYLTVITGFFLVNSIGNIIDSDDGVLWAGVVAFVVAGGVAFVVAGGVAGGVAFGVAEGMAFVLAVSVAFVLAVSVAFVVAEEVAEEVAEGMAGGVAGGVAGGMAGGVAGGMAGGVAGVVAGGMAGGVAGVVAGGSTLPLPWFLAFAALIPFAIAPAKEIWVFITTTAILIALSAENLGWLSTLVIPITLISYYRVPDYLFFALLSFFTSITSRFRPQPLQLLHNLPPYTSELLWLPLPNHSQLFISAFRSNPEKALNIFQYTQTFSLPGLQITLQNALPQIVADQLQQIQTIPELLFTANSDHPILPFLIYPLYHLDAESDTPISETPLLEVTLELPSILLRLQKIVQDIQSALENKNIALRERGLERINNNLVKLQFKLPSLVIKSEAIKRWTPVLERWQRVIELEKNEQRKLSEGELINPFQYGNPVRLNQKQLFKGRQKFADEVVSRVLNNDRPTLILHGPRRCGKTSFLYNLPRLFPSDILSVFLDMQSSAITNKESDFCYGLVRAIHKDCKIQGVKLANIPQRTEFEASPYPTLEDWLDEAVKEIGERRILINFDEFEKIGTAIQNGQISLRLFDQLRHLIQHYEQLGFLFSGVQTLDELGPNWSSYFISVVPIEMLYLQPNEAEELLLNPDPAFKLRYAPGIVEELLALTNCHPYCLQLLGASMVNQANFNSTDLITPELLQSSINEAFISGQPYFTNTWKEFTGTNPEEIAIGQELLLQVAKTDNLISINNPTEEKVLTRLLRYHILQEINGGYDFEIPLFKQWVKEKAIKS